MSDGSFEQMVNQLVGLGWSRATAEISVRQQYPELAPTATVDEDRARVLEKAEQYESMRLYRALGCKVYTTSQARASKVSAGIPDMLVFAPRAHAFFFHEAKRSVGGEQSPAQREFQEMCAECGETYLLGDRDVAQQQLVNLGLGIVVDRKIEPAHLYAPRGKSA